MQSTASVMIDRGINDVFRLTIDHVPSWSDLVVEDVVVEDKNHGGPGTTFRIVTEENGRRMEFDGIVTRHDPPHAKTIEMVGKSFDIEADYRFEEIAGQTRVTQTSIVQGKGALKVFFALFGWMMGKASCNALQKELDSLKAFCESQPT